MKLRVGWGQKFLLGPKIGSGSFGEIYAGTNSHNNEAVAIKLELLEARHPQLLDEFHIYRDLQGDCRFPILCIEVIFSFRRWNS
jgi:serine/threonine protein kinase